MPLTLPSSFSNHSIKQNWLVQLYNSDHVEGVTTSAFIGLSFYHAELDSNEYYPFINNKPSIRESINLKNQTSSTSNVSLTCSNDKIFKNSFLSLSEHLHGQSIKYLNRAVKIYIQPNDSTSISDCLLIYTGKLVDISHDLSQVYLSITAKSIWL